MVYNAEKLAKNSYSRLREYFNIISKIPFLQDASNNSIKVWLYQTLEMIRKSVGAKAIGYMFGQFDIFANVTSDTGHNFIDIGLTEKIEELLIYKLYLTNIKGACIMQCSPTNGNYITKSLDIKKVLLVPLVEDFSTKSIIAYGFDKADFCFDFDETLFLSLLNQNITNQIKSAKKHSSLRNFITGFEEEFINTLIFTIEARDPYTKGHSQRVAFYASLIAEKLDLDDSFKSQIYVSSLLHDIGKIGIPDNVLLKPARLSKNEFEIIKHHSVFSYEIVKNIKNFSNFESVPNMIRQHHERIDGSGYPDSIKGDEICLGAKILAIADSFDALTTKRLYRKSFSAAEAIDIMFAEKGHFDLKVLSVAENILKEQCLCEIDSVENFIVPKYFEEYRNKFADSDTFTGLFNRSALVKYLKELIESKHKFVVFMIDIKDLGTINMLEGSETGDEIILISAELLKNISSLIKQQKNIELNIVSQSRIGGDSFMFILLPKDKNDFQIAKSYLRDFDAILKKNLTKPLIIDPAYNVTYAFYPEDGFSPDELIYRCTRKKKTGNTLEKTI